MNEIVSFTKEIDFNNNIDKIVSISLEHTIGLNDDSSIKGDLIVSGSYRQNQATLVDTPFSYKIPVDIVLDSKYDLTNITVDIDNFTYDTENNKLIVSVDLIIDNLELKPVKEEVININDLFLENNDEIKLEMKKDDNYEVETTKEEQTTIKEQEKNSDSLFSNISSSNETYITYSIYIMKENDNIEDIMNKYKVSRVELEEYNNLSDIKNGTKLIIPNSNE